ncbi:MAG TPA: hypothetical protein VFM24_07480 [Nitrospira sp.]|nr:hypothetical protein [Nitrospira sp.]
MASGSPEVYIEEHNIVVGSGGMGSRAWPVYWSAIWAGALTAFALALIFGLIGTAVGAHQIGKKIINVHDLSFWGLVFSVAGAFFSFVAGGWVAASIGGFRRAEDSALHGALSWLVALPLVLVLGALGATSFLGAWYSGLAGTPVWASSSTMTADPNAAAIARNSAIGAVTALLLGLVGAVIGGWWASGEPMSLTYRRAQQEVSERPRARAA